MSFLPEYNKKAGFVLETTAPSLSFQNIITEWLHFTLGNMMRAMLLGADLGSEFWSDTLLYSVYLKNRLPHTLLENTQTPYESLV